MKIGAAAPGIESRSTLRPYVVTALVTTMILAVVGMTYRYLFPGGARAYVRQAVYDRGYGFYGEISRPLDLFAALARLPARVAENLTRKSELPAIFIDIKFRHLQKLYAKRQEALNIGFLIQETDDFVPASIRLGDRTVPVKLRLKGDMLDHLRSEKWSFRIQTKGDEELFGLRRFSVQHPVTRGFQAEVLFKETLREFDVLTPKYFFANVVVNGNEVGVMAVEEHFSKELLERNGRSDGVIVRLDESLIWSSRAARGERNPRTLGPFDSFFVAPIEAFQPARIEKSERLKRQLEVASGLLRAFRDGKAAASDVFDVELLGSYLATVEFWGAWHSTTWNNQRFYLNPLTLRLEPIAYDASLDTEPQLGTIVTWGSLVYQMLDDAAVRAVFEQKLRSLRYAVEHGDLISRLEKAQERALRELRTEYLFLEAIDLAALEERARQLPYEHGKPEPPRPYPQHVMAELVQDGERHFLELANPLPQVVVVHAVEWVDVTGNASPFEPVQELQLPMALAATLPDTRPEILRLEYQGHPAVEQKSLRVTTNVVGEGERKVTTARRGFAALTSSPIPTSDLATALARHEFLSVDSTGKLVTVRKGRWRVNGSLVMPPNVALRVPSGTTLQFEREAALIAYGPTDFQGTSLEPIVLEGQLQADGTEAEWQGIVVHRANSRSSWSHVVVRNTTGLAQDAWQLTGGVTFYRSDITLSECVLTGNRGEDALNIVHSNFALENVTIRETASDGLDSDFSTGKVDGGLFERIGVASGADALDTSGSEVIVTGTRFSGITDKAISVGERSTVRVQDIAVDSSGVGAVSKDGSDLQLVDSIIRGARIAGLMTYVKKPEFGPSVLTATNVRILETPQETIAQHGSTLVLDGSPVLRQAVDVDELYRTAMRPELRQ